MKDYDINSDNKITNPGKFEGQPRWVPYFWDMFLNGFADSAGADLTFMVTAEDRIEFPELDGVDAVSLVEDDQGFVVGDVLVEAPPMKVYVYVGDPIHEGGMWMVTLTVFADDVEQARHDQTICGSRWESTDEVAYALLAIFNGGDHTDESCDAALAAILEEMRDAGYVPVVVP